MNYDLGWIFWWGIQYNQRIEWWKGNLLRCRRPGDRSEWEGTEKVISHYCHYPDRKLLEGESQADCKKGKCNCCASQLKLKLLRTWATKSIIGSRHYIQIYIQPFTAQSVMSYIQSMLFSCRSNFSFSFYFYKPQAASLSPLSAEDGRNA